MAGVAGLEPAHARIKTLCLTNLATPQSFKFIFLSMNALCRVKIISRSNRFHHAAKRERRMNVFYQCIKKATGPRSGNLLHFQKSAILRRAEASVKSGVILLILWFSLV